jgi:signal recognition particle subunit SRP54
MFSNLSSRLKQVAEKVRGRGRLTEENLQEVIREVRQALLEADVALPVVRSFVDRVRERALGAEVLASLSPGQMFIKILQTELTEMLGGGSAELDLRHQPPVIILLAGLQGAGKTTTAAKLAVWLREKERKKTLLVSLDTRRPAAMEQLQQLAQKVDAGFMAFTEGDSPQEIAGKAVQEARRSQADVLILDTAGRTRLDQELLDELSDLHALTNPAETLFVIDSMAGQDAVNVVQAFGEALPLTGVIVTKVDGDARGGAALSVKSVTGKPIKFIGTGEQVSALEAFHPDRLASRILGMGDVLSLVEEVEQKIDKKQADKLAGKMKKGQAFDYSDLRDQLEQMMNMGGIAGLLDKMPLPGSVDANAVAKGMDDKSLKRQVAIINSMTAKERRFPKLMNGSRKRRIAMGAGLQVQDVNRLIKQHMQMQKMMKRARKGGMQKMLQGLQGPGPGPR